MESNPRNTAKATVNDPDKALNETHFEMPISTPFTNSIDRNIPNKC